MNNQEQKNWLLNTGCDLFVSMEYFHHHAFEIISTHNYLKDDFLGCLNSPIKLDTRLKKTGNKVSKGIKADFLNIEIRKLLKEINKTDIKFEVNEERGVFYFSSEKSTIGGFDFAILNHYKNLVALRNLCFGELRFHDGESKWNKFLSKNPELEEIAKTLINSSETGIDYSFEELIHNDSLVPLIVGEIQFGNWALAYRDLFKVLKANVQNSIDCLIYIVPTGDLEGMLSDGIVTFDSVKRIIIDFAKVISVPIWVVGIDVRNFK
jgi:hypothetical protein